MGRNPTTYEYTGCQGPFAGRIGRFRRLLYNDASIQDDAIEHFEMGEASDDIKEDCSETSQPVDEEVRSRKTSVGSIRCLAIHKNNNLVSGSKCF